MDWILKQLTDVNIIQAIISIGSALIVGSFTFILNKRKYFDQQWWQKKIDKYEYCIVLLSKLEHLYNEWVVDMENGTSKKNKLMDSHSKLLLEIKSQMFSSSFYLDKKSNIALKEINDVLDNAEIEWSFNNIDPYEIISEACLSIEKTKKVIMENAKRELNL